MERSRCSSVASMHLPCRPRREATWTERRPRKLARTSNLPLLTSCPTGKTGLTARTIRLERVLRVFVHHYNGHRTHRSLNLTRADARARTGTPSLRVTFNLRLQLPRLPE